MKGEIQREPFSKSHFLLFSLNTIEGKVPFDCGVFVEIKSVDWGKIEGYKTNGANQTKPIQGTCHPTIRNLRFGCF